jgi:CheY-like chemotaxis protein
MVELLKVSISKRASLETDLALQLPSVLGNTTQMRQVVMNLIINASDAIGEKDGTIRITTSRVTISEDEAPNRTVRPPEGEYVRLEIADTGCGMTEEARRRIFDPFFTTKAGGHGLGMAVVQGIVRSHGGVVNVSSVAGQGSTFEVLLPCARDLAGRVSPGTPASAMNRLAVNSRTVLLVEEEESLRISVGKALRKRGFSVLSASPGTAALDIFRDHVEEIGAVVMDLAPGGAGIETLKRMHQIQAGVPAILTADERDARARERTGNELGVTLLRKPYRIAELVGHLRKALSARTGNAVIRQAAVVVRSQP